MRVVHFVSVFLWLPLPVYVCCLHSSIYVSFAVCTHLSIYVSSDLSSSLPIYLPVPVYLCVPVCPCVSQVFSAVCGLPDTLDVPCTCTHHVGEIISNTYTLHNETSRTYVYFLKST